MKWCWNCNENNNNSNRDGTLLEGRTGFTYTIHISRLSGGIAGVWHAYSNIHGSTGWDSKDFGLSLAGWGMYYMDCYTVASSLWMAGNVVMRCLYYDG